MKFKPGDILYYVNPYVFTIEKVLIEFVDDNIDETHYIDYAGAYLKEWDLFSRIEEAKGHALQLLEKFYGEKQNEIWKSDPGLFLGS